ncbi:hypothetical protein [Streptomyces sp. NBC_01236]|uniref:hypothetical protein n=1 Tax=Streptomyces sp. NBC_01236 TaxID=2903789 RepID=UPI002E14E832|nr:hypothetical protein OG324_00395 [Streptomyces sp. NBC_01236]
MPVPSSLATRRMDSASMPSASAIAMAAAVISARVREGAGPFAARCGRFQITV